MALWKKIIIAILIVILLLIIGIALFIRSLPDLCGNEILTEVNSPNGKLKAITYERNCGATTAFSTHVAILPRNSNLEKDGKTILAADTARGKAPAGRGGGPEVRIHWLSDTSLEVQYHQLAHVRLSKKTSMGVQVFYCTFQ
ncbi:MAG: DUF5412 family protein [Smithella sp.]